MNWPGRLQLIQKPNGQKILLDGAHNVGRRKSAARGAGKTFCRRSDRLLIFGALADKNWLDICEILAPLAAKIFTVPVASERTADARELAAACRPANPQAEVGGGLENLAEALNASKDEPFIVVTGSLYLVGEALEQIGLVAGSGGERGLNEWSAAGERR